MDHPNGLDDTARSLVVIGASAGGIAPLLELVSLLPAGLPAAILVTVHTGGSKSALPRLIARAGALEASHAEDGERIRAGHVYVAPPDFHLVVRDAHLGLSHGPKENHSRPAIDPLFRSAAQHYGPNVIGVILSGALSDGSAGLLSIRAHGGVALVQEPEEATIDGMPRSAIRMGAADEVLTTADMAERIPGLIRKRHEGKGARSMPEFTDDAEAIIRTDFARQRRDTRAGEVTMFTCPDCGGSLWQLDEGPTLSFRCHVGHAWSPESLLANKSDQLEAALWAAVRLFSERSTLSQQVARRLRETGSDTLDPTRIDDDALQDAEYASILRAMLESPRLIEDNSMQTDHLVDRDHGG